MPKSTSASTARSAGSLTFILPATILGLLSPAKVSALDNGEKQFVVSQVNLERETQLSPGEQTTIRSRLTGRCFDSPQVDELASIVLDALQTSGYLRATVLDPTVRIVDITRHPEPVSLTFDVDQGARYKVREVVLSGMKALTADQLFSISLLRPEDILDTRKVRETIDAMRRLYAAIGSPTASIVNQFQVHEAGHWVGLYFSIVEGPQLP